MTNLIQASLVPHPLNLISNSGDVDIEATREFLEISRQELATAFGFTADQLRPERMSDKVRERIKELATALELAAVALNGDRQKTLYWLKTPNPNFGGASPRALILKGRAHKVMQFIFSASTAYPKEA